MKKWRKILGIVLAVVAGLYAWSRWSRHVLRASVEETRQQLRQAGFKTELSEFDLVLTGEMRQRADTLLAASRRLPETRALYELKLMQFINADTALRTTASQFIPSEYFPPPTISVDGEFRRRYMSAPSVTSPITVVPDDFEVMQPPEQLNLWDRISDELNAYSDQFNGIHGSLSSGGFRFEPVSTGNDFLLPYLGDVKRLAQALSAQAALELHQNLTTNAFTNLLALSQLCTRWQPEPVEFSHLVRLACVQLAQAPLWEALQSEVWNDEQLAALQREWESAEFFAGLPEAVALQRAVLVQKCRDARTESYFVEIGGWPALRHAGGYALRSPAAGFRDLRGLWGGYRNHSRYQEAASYEDERRVLLYFRDRESEMRRAVVCKTWIEMRAIPGVTNIATFQAAPASRIGSLINMRQLQLGMIAGGRNPLGRAAEVETRRRLIVTALAIKRFHLKHGYNPNSLGELAPTLVASVPLDFMDGRELRYRKFEDARFILYSVGLDGIDDGGRLKTRDQIRDQVRQQRRQGDYAAFSPYQNSDLVWPKPANEDETLVYEMSTDKTVIRLNEVLLREIETKYLPQKPAQSFWPYATEFE